ncbi:hypothetical protein [Pseudonocardia sediminis]|uniref:hypothetical protein n=1 Tax=Pseudonocardia sediminis TaxID=1397368 RepID=UPI001A9256E9|nr:hypothetical protein [Pseudonocardia sediminis]
MAISAPMVAALEAAWAAIRARNPELPPVVIVLGAGSGDRGGLRLGHFAAMRWTATDNDDHRHEDERDEDGRRLAEVFVGGEGLARGPVDVFGTLLHEAAHALAHVRGVQDTSRQGRWHNARFKAFAEEIGVAVEKDPKLGWSPTTVPDATRAVYAAAIGELGRALRMRRASETTGGAEKPKKPGPPACVCACGRRIRVAVSVREAGPILCGICEAEFLPEDLDGGPDDGSPEDGADAG